MLAMSGSLRDALIAVSWPKYPHDAYFGTWPSAPVPILVLQGGLDPITPYGDVVKPHYSGTHQYYVEFPLAGHVPALGSPMTGPAG